MAVPAKNLAPMQEELDYPSAAAPILVSLAAWRMPIHRGGLRAGESVLVVDAVGGVNSMAIQIVKLAGATVYVVAGDEEKGARAKQLGADVVLDRSKVDGLVKSLYSVMPDLIRHPEVSENTGFRLSPE